jgi:hypothetical protein
MANVVLPVSQITKDDGTQVIQTNVTTQDFYFNNDQRTFIEIYNGHSGAASFYVKASNNCDQSYLEDVLINVPAKSTAEIGLFDAKRFNQSADFVGKCRIRPAGDLTGLNVYIGAYRL